MKCIIANFGDDSIALIQHVYELGLQDVVVLSIDTGWQAENWQQRVDIASQWVKSLGFKHEHLVAEHGFEELVTARKQFPSQQFHWCAGFLKGMPTLNWLDENDEALEALILLPHRKDMSRSQADLSNMIESSERYDDREVHYPLAEITQEIRNTLIAKTPFKTPLNHRSLECHACIHFGQQETGLLNATDINRTVTLEENVGKKMFEVPFDKYIQAVQKTHNYYDEFAKACSWDYGCGL